MIKGLEQFKEHFNEFTKNYVLIGGTACTLAMEQAGLPFRSTRDLDIVLHLEALDHKFSEAFWNFLRKGDYQNKQKSSGKKIFYRFDHPQNPTFPEKLELFSRKPGVIDLPDHCHLTPIPIDEEISSLSAILLDDECYQFTHKGKQEIEGLPVLRPEYLIPLKARAWWNLTNESSGDEKHIRKHKNDIVRLYQLLTSNMKIHLPPMLKQDMKKFLDELKKNPVDLKTLDLKQINHDEMLVLLERIYFAF